MLLSAVVFAMMVMAPKVQSLGMLGATRFAASHCPFGYRIFAMMVMAVPRADRGMRGSKSYPPSRSPWTAPQGTALVTQ